MSRGPATASRLAATCAALGVLLAFAIAAAVSLGAGPSGPRALLSWSPSDPVARAIVLEVRLPRALLAAVLGGSLAVAGVVFQALLRNPLADPYVLGVSGGASIGGALALVVGLGAGAGIGGALGLPAFAFLGALGALVLIERIATVDGRLTVYTALLTGAIFNAFSAALIYLLQSLASLEQLHAIVFYLMGRVPNDVGGAAIGGLGAFSVAATVALFSMAREYNALSLGEDGAAQLGVDVERLKRRTFVLGSLLTGLAVSVAGLVGFVGLVVPHVLRLLFGPDHRVLLPAAFLGGASFLVLADLLARVAAPPLEIPIGAITALVGGPFFLVLLRRRHASHGPV